MAILTSTSCFAADNSSISTPPLSQFQSSLKKAEKKSPHASTSKAHTYEQFTQEIQPHLAYNAPSTLPENWPRQYYLDHIANILGWKSDPKIKNLCEGTYKIPQFLRNNPALNEKAPMEISSRGEEMLKQEGISELRKDVVVTQPGRVVYADKVFLFRNKQGKIYKIVLIGHVRIYQEKSVLVSDDALITLHPRTAYVSSLAYRYYSNVDGQQFNAWGVAKQGGQDRKKVLTLHHASYSTCNPNYPTWQVFANKIVIDKPDDVGKVYNATLKIATLPVLWLPYYAFQLSNKRKSGFLTPIYGHEDRAGTYVGIPYYFNLAPNYDLLVTSEYYGRRGFRAIANFRYLTKSTAGYIRASVLPNDKIFTSERSNYATTYTSDPTSYPPNIYQPYLNNLKTMQNTRGYFSTENDSDFTPHFWMRYYLNWVTDPYYFQDITNITMPTEDLLTNQLLNMVQADYSTSHWDLNSYALHYQTLHNITLLPYSNQALQALQSLDQFSNLPGINLNTYYTLTRNLDFQMYTDYNNFTYSSLLPPAKPTGQRLHIRPGLSWSLNSSGAYIKPEVWVDSVGYDLNKTIPGIKKTSSRTLSTLR